MRKSLGTLVTGAALLAVLAGCGSQTSGTSSPSSNSSTSTSSSTSTTAPATTTTTPPLARGLQGPRSAVPWNEVGPGWFLALWGPARGLAPGQATPPGEPSFEDETRTLFLVDPLGGRYSLKSFPAGDFVGLAGWSGDGRRALLQSGTVVTEIDLSSGVVLNRFHLAAQQSVLTYTRPKGLAILVNGPAGLSRVGRDGSLELTYPGKFSEVGAYEGTAIYTADGTQIVMGAETGLALVGNNGHLAAQLPVPGVTEGCSAERWWRPGVALASCLLNGVSRLWLVPISGAAPTALTAPPKPPDLGDEDAWHIAAGTYVQDAGACGYQYVAKLDARSTTKPVDIPDVTGGSTYIVGTFGDDLAVRATVACGGGTSLLWFDPVADTTTVLLGPPLNGGGVIQVLENPSDDG